MPRTPELHSPHPTRRDQRAPARRRTTELGAACAGLRRAPSVAQTPARVSAGLFILNSGLDQWRAQAPVADGVHALAAGAYPVLGRLRSDRFLRVSATSQLVLGVLLLIPAVPAAVGGAGLTAFSAALLGIYTRTPGMHQRLRPTGAGTALAKDVWMLGIGLNLLVDAVLGARAGRTGSRGRR